MVVMGNPTRRRDLAESLALDEDLRHAIENEVTEAGGVLLPVLGLNANRRAVELEDPILSLLVH